MEKGRRRHQRKLESAMIFYYHGILPITLMIYIFVYIYIYPFGVDINLVPCGYGLCLPQVL